MSRHRENVIWESRDRKWNRGFFDFRVTGPDDEWDVEYDHKSFKWVTTDLPTEDAARESWPGANPGGYQRVLWCKDNRDEIARYEKMALAFKKRESRAPTRGSRREEEMPVSPPRRSMAQLERDIQETLQKHKKPWSW